MPDAPSASSVPITRPATVEAFLKAHTAGLRIDKGAIDALAGLVNTLAGAVAAKADELAKADHRNTLLDRDLTQAYEALVWTGGGGGPPPDPTLLFAQLQRLSTDQVAKFSSLINEWLKAQAG